MNLSATIQAYLEAQLSPTEEAQLRAALLNKKERTPEEESIVAMLQADAATQPDEAWWSDEGVAEYDALLAQQEAAVPKTVKLAPTFGWRWAGGVAAAAVLAIGLWQSAPLWHNSPTAPSSAPTIALAKPTGTPSSPPSPASQPPKLQTSPLPKPAERPATSAAPRPRPAVASPSQQPLVELSAPKLLQPLAPSALLAEQRMTTEEREANLRLQADYLHYRMEEMLVAAQIALDYQQYLKEHPFAEAEVHYVEL